MKKYIFPIIALILFALLFTVCSADDGIEYNAETKTLTVSTQSALESCDLSIYETENLIIAGDITYIQPNAFSHRQDIKTVKITAPVEIIDNAAFYSDLNLSEIDFGTHLKKIGLSVFSGTKLTHIEFPLGFEEVGESSFYKCFELCEVIFPSTLKKIDKWGFYYCDSLKTIELPEGLEYIGDCGFYRCHGLKHIELPESLTFLGGAVFYEDTSLESVYIPDSVTDLDDTLFEGCTSLKEVFIPKNCKTVGISVFSRCDGLLCVHFPDTCENIDSDAFYRNNISVLFGNAFIKDYCNENYCDYSKEPNFTDVPKYSWYSPYANYCFAKKLMVGTSNNTFTPNKKLDSNTVCLIIAKATNADLSNYSGTAWYSKSNAYASEHYPELLNKKTITRLEFIKALYKLSDNKTESDKELPFNDISTLNKNEISAVKWAYDNNIAKGTSENTFSPSTPITRAQCAVMITSYMLNYNK